MNPAMPDAQLLNPAEWLIEQVAIDAESIGWFPLGDGAYLHVGNPDEEQVVITVTGVPDAGMVNLNILLLT